MPYVTLDDVKIYYEVYGPEFGQPLLLLEGWGWYSWMWFRQLPELSKKYRCIVVDNRGVGKSSKPDYPYEMKMFAKDAIGILDHLNIQKAYVLGISMGGYIAQEFVLDYPERVLSLILVSTTFGGPNAVEADYETMTKIYAIKTETISFEQAYQMKMSVLASKEWIDNNKKITDQIRIWIYQNPQPISANLNQSHARTGFNVEEKLSSISQPTLIIQGDSDLVVPPKNAELLHEKIPNSKLVMIEKGQHWSFITHYQQFNQIVMEFLEKFSNS